MSNSSQNSLRVLLTRIVDYAGLFPPSQVSMAVAVQNYAEYLKNEYSWILGRFIVPVANLDKFRKEAERFFNGEPWRLSVIAGENVAQDLRKIERFNQRNKGQAVIEAVEIKTSSTAEVQQISKVLPEGLISFFEFPTTEVLTDFMTALAIEKNSAKIRTGGITPGAFPSTDAIIKFMRVCIAANVPFKATAGLHHPLRCTRPLTYEENAPKGAMHGFLNLFLSACFLRQNLNNSFVHQLMNETQGESFSFDDDEIRWGEHSISTSMVELVRQKNAISFGSCSFLEPVEDLQSLGLL